MVETWQKNGNFLAINCQIIATNVRSDTLFYYNDTVYYLDMRTRVALMCLGILTVSACGKAPTDSTAYQAEAASCRMLKAVNDQGGLNNLTNSQINQVRQNLYRETYNVIQNTPDAQPSPSANLQPALQPCNPQTGILND